MNWQTIAELTERMQTHASAQQWEEVLQLSVERQQILERFFTGIGSINQDEQQKILQDVQALLEKDQQLMSTASELKMIVGMELTKIANGRKAIKDYQTFQQS